MDPSVLKVEPALAFKIGDRVERVEPMYWRGRLSRMRGAVKNFDPPVTDLGPMWVRVRLDNGGSESFHPREIRKLTLIEQVGELEDERGQGEGVVC